MHGVQIDTPIDDLKTNRRAKVMDRLSVELDARRARGEEVLTPTVEEVEQGDAGSRYQQVMIGKDSNALMRSVKKQYARTTGFISANPGTTLLLATGACVAVYYLTKEKYKPGKQRSLQGLAGVGRSKPAKKTDKANKRRSRK